MNVIETPLDGVKIIEPRVFADERGFFLESWNARAFREAGLDLAFVQDNHSRSAKGVLRGLHYQLARPQGKLVRVSHGRVFDVVVDIRPKSRTYGQWLGLELSADNNRVLWIPSGYAHGFVALENDTHFLYKCTDYYSPEHERTILWSDPAIGIAWPIDKAAAIVSPKDAAGLPLSAAELDW